MRFIALGDMELIRNYLRSGHLSLSVRDITKNDARCVDKSWDPAKTRDGMDALLNPGDPGENFVSERLWAAYTAVAVPVFVRK